MTHNIQSSLFQRIHSNHKYPAMIYTVVINTEDESYEYEVEADTYHEACEKAEQMANDLMQDIVYIEIYSFE